jgi:cytochrome c oxidase cbb3-type subunit 3
MRKVTVMLAVAGLATAAAFVSPTEGTAAQSGAKVYSSKCAGCHGPDGSGNISSAPNFTDAEWQASRTDAQLAESIKNGKGKIMPAWGKQLSDAQITELVQHVRSLKK